MHRNNKELWAWLAIVTRIINYPGSSLNLQINTIWDGHQLSLLSSNEILKHIRATVYAIGKQKPETDTIMTKGRWNSDAFLIYTRKQVAAFSAGLSYAMTNGNTEFFTVPESSTTEN